jgi:hypothetical protein
MFPRAPFYDLPLLNALIRHDLPVPSGSIPEAFREMWPALRRQFRDEGHFLRRELSPMGRPYREDFHLEALGEKMRSDRRGASRVGRRVGTMERDHGREA